jgi:RNA polymerase-binding transcription factor DksA
MDEARARKLIDQERSRIGYLVDELKSEGITTMSESEQSGESSHPQHEADLGSETFEREKDFSLLESLEGELADLATALRKVDEGTYGICEACSKPIPAERLEAVPAARFCIDDQPRR